MRQHSEESSDPLRVEMVAPGRYVASARPPASKLPLEISTPSKFSHVARELKRVGVYQADIQNASLDADTQWRLKNGRPAPSWMPPNVARDFGFVEHDTFLRELRRDFVTWLARLRK